MYTIYFLSFVVCYLFAFNCPNSIFEIILIWFLILFGWVPDIDLDQLRNEYIIFSKSFDDLMSGVNLPTLLHEEAELKSSNESSEEENNEIEKRQVNKTKICVTTIINVLSKYELSAAFPNLYTAYKVLGTIPVSSASAERSFSKVSMIVLLNAYKI